MGLIQTESLGGKKYIMVIMNDYQDILGYYVKRKVWSFDLVRKLFRKLQTKKNLFISRIQSNHDKEFENTNFSSYCDEHDVHQEFCTLITSQQNGIVERKNRYTEEMARTMLNSKKVALYF